MNSISSWTIWELAHRKFLRKPELPFPKKPLYKISWKTQWLPSSMERMKSSTTFNYAKASCCSLCKEDQNWKKILKHTSVLNSLEILFAETLQAKTQILLGLWKIESLSKMKNSKISKKLKWVLWMSSWGWKRKKKCLWKESWNSSWYSWRMPNPLMWIKQLWISVLKFNRWI